MPTTSPRGRSGRRPSGRNRRPGVAARSRRGRSRRGSAPLRLRTGFVFIALVLSFFGARLVQLQGVEPEKYATLAASTGGTVTVDLPAKRGDIFDRNGRALAESVAGRMVVADPLQTRAVAPQLARFLALPALGDRAKAAGSLVVEKDIVGNREGGDQAQLDA